MHRYDHALFKVNDKDRMCKENLDDMSKTRDFYGSLIDKLQDERFIKEEGSIEQIEILERVAEIDKFINENNLKLKTY